MLLEIFPKPLVGYETDDQLKFILSSKNLDNRSPLNLLDDFLKYGSDIYSHHLTQVPLTSQRDTDWNYYGGKTPVDELKILQTQVQLLSIQLQYERYKCDLHCLRNRRLFGNLQKCKKDHEEVYTLKDQILMWESKLQEMKLGLSFKCEENRQLKQVLNKREEELLSKICKLEDENDRFRFELKNYDLKGKNDIERINSLENELRLVKYQLFDITHLYKEALSKLTQRDHYQFVTDVLEREFLTHYDRQENLKYELDQSVMQMEQHVDLKSKITSLKNKLKSFEEEKDIFQQQTETYKLKVDELELSISKKDSLITEQRAYTKKLSLKHKFEITALENRFQSSVKTSQSLQSYITCLYAKLEETQGFQTSNGYPKESSSSHLSCVDRCRKISYSGPGSLNLPSTHDHSHRHSFHNVDNPPRSQKQSMYEDGMEPPLN